MTKNETMGDDGIDQPTDQVNTSEDVQNGKDQESRKRRANFYEAALKGEWNKAEEILKDYPDYVEASLPVVEEDTALHVAARAGHSDFVKELIMSKYMKEEVLKKKNEESNTAFSLAAIS